MKIVSFCLLVLVLAVMTHSQIAKKDATDYEALNQRRTFSYDKIQNIDRQMEKDAFSAEQRFIALNPSKIDIYTLATTVFNSQAYLGDLCTRCKKLEYFAFRQGGNYLTDNGSYLTFNAATQPANNQLFVGQQQIDGTWAFKTFSGNRYIRADNDGSTINFQFYIGPWERWYIERHGDHVHIQSAQFSNFYWITSSPYLKQLNGGASAYIVEHWPVLKWGWNW